MSIAEDMHRTAALSLAASRELVLLSSRKKNNILRAMADAIDENRPAILEANNLDLSEADLDEAPSRIVSGLRLSERDVAVMSKRMRDTADLKDPVGAAISRWIRPNGLEIVKRRVPIGVIAVIHEARPTFTSDAAAMGIKTANAVILRGHRLAVRTNIAIVEALRQGGAAKGLPENALQLLASATREAVHALVALNGLVDLVIPLGGAELIRDVTDHARIPVLRQHRGVCHTYVDESADLDMALNVVENAKCEGPESCNATETLLVHEAVSKAFLPMIEERLGARGVSFRGDDAAVRVINGADAARDFDWCADYQDLLLAVKVVSSIEEAIEHINRYGAHDSDAIIAQSEAAQKTFCQMVDSAAVYVNASTRFTDGAEFGMGTDIGVSTDKLHARGPMGLEELTTYKYLIHGKGQMRE